MKTYQLQRTIPVDEGFDVVVAGGGPGGTAAAICAARLGAKVLLVEATGSLGGMGTSALVSNWMDLADGERMFVGGFACELIEAMYARGGFPPGVDPDSWRKQLHGGVGFNAEVLKRLLDEFCVKAGVEVRFFTRVIDVDVTGRTVNGVVLNNIEGHRYVPAKKVVDATGDAVLADLCGAAYREAGRDTPDIMPPTLCATQAGINWNFEYEEQQKAVEQGLADGYFSQPDRHVPGLFRGGRDTGMMNAGHIFGMTL